MRYNFFYFLPPSRPERSSPLFLPTIFFSYFRAVLCLAAGVSSPNHYRWFWLPPLVVTGSDGVLSGKQDSPLVYLLPPLFRSFLAHLFSFSQRVLYVCFLDIVPAIFLTFFLFSSDFSHPLPVPNFVCFFRWYSGPVVLDWPPFSPLFFFPRRACPSFSHVPPFPFRGQTQNSPAWLCRPFLCWVVGFPSV